MRRSVSSWRVPVAVGLWLALWPGPRVSAEVIDRVLAIVSGSIITLSDVRAAIDLGLVERSGTGDPMAAAVKALIERRLVLDEAGRSSAPDPDAAAVERRVALVRARFSDDEAYGRALAAAGLDAAGVRQLLREALRAQTYLDRRFEATLPPSEEDVRAHYLANPGSFTRDGALSPLDEVRGAIVERLLDDRRRIATESWVARLRRRAEVVELYLPLR
jgi:hypothetical protein